MHRLRLLWAGQDVSQHLFQDISWKSDRATAKNMFPAFKVVRQLREMLWYPSEATNRTFGPGASLQFSELRMATGKTLDDTQQVLTSDFGELHISVRSVRMDVSKDAPLISQPVKITPMLY